MTEPATDKQINFAIKLGIEAPEQFSKDTLKELIDKKLNPESGQTQKGSESVSKQETLVSKHDVVVTRAEKPHSYEFGRASARHKIYYEFVQELQDHIKLLKSAGLIEVEDLE